MLNRSGLTSTRVSRGISVTVISGVSSRYVLLARQGYVVAGEFPLGGGKTADLRADRSDHVLLIEVETGRSDIAENVAKYPSDVDPSCSSQAPTSRRGSTISSCSIDPAHAA